MAIKIKFNNEPFMREVEFSRTAHNIVTLVGENIPENTSGFHTYQKDKLFELGNLSDYCTVYHKLPNAIQFSNDGSVWQEPKPVEMPEVIPSEPIPTTPTVSLEERVADLEAALIELYESKGV